MGIKKIARPINKAKNEFVKWLKKKGATDIDVYDGSDEPLWGYYREVATNIEDRLLFGRFKMWNGKSCIELFINNEYKYLTLEEFNDLIK
jgi:hypothetical protein